MATLEQSLVRAAAKHGVNQICKCGSYFWDDSFILKCISGIASPTGKAQMVEFKVKVCRSCGEINKEQLYLLSKPAAEG